MVMEMTHPFQLLHLFNQVKKFLFKNISKNKFLGTYLPITGVLRTKWPTIELKWDDDAKPSLN
jgi:hypothetical protein